MSVTETPRLRLRRVVHGDAPFILELLTDPDFLANVGDRGVRDLQSARRYIAEVPGASYQRLGFGLWLVERKDSGQPLGLCGLLRRDTHPDVEIGFALLPAARGYGYAHEAAAATLHLALGTLGLRRVVAITAPGNAASIGLLERLGFKYERTGRYSGDGESRLFVLDRSAAP